jgi:hypothetical protein
MVTVNGGGTGGRSCAAFTMILVAVESLWSLGRRLKYVLLDARHMLVMKQQVAMRWLAPVIRHHHHTRD